jgi:hypothetical protein
MVSTTSARSSWIRWLLQRWPTALAIVPAALILTGPQAEVKREVAELLPLLPLEYLIVAKLGRRQATWPVITVALLATIVLQELDLAPLPTVVAAVALVVLVLGAVDGQLSRDGAFRVQALGMLGFGALALFWLVVEPEVGRYLAAAGWFLHGIWDLVYFKRDEVVARSYAEWCAGVDILVAAGLVFLL